MQSDSYLFISNRLGFRNWKQSDVQAFAAINADAEVMRFFESPMTLQQTADFITRMQSEFENCGHCYFAVEILETKELIGCIGLGNKDFESNFTPCVDVGWRLGKAFWGKGYATEGAQRCLDYGFEQLRLNKIYAITPQINKPSFGVMDKIGMHLDQIFVHPKLDADGPLNPCLAYVIMV